MIIIKIIVIWKFSYTKIKKGRFLHKAVDVPVLVPLKMETYAQIFFIVAFIYIFVYASSKLKNRSRTKSKQKTTCTTEMKKV